MKRPIHFILFVFLLLPGTIPSLSGCGKNEEKRSPRRLSIAVIPKGTTHEFWKSIHAGAVKAANELGLEIIWKGPTKEDDRSQQIMVVEDFISKRVDGIVLAPLDDRALVMPVQEAVDENIPVVIIDSGLEGEGYVSFVATDNYKGGVLGAKRLGEILNGKGKVLLLRYQEGSASTEKREKGFIDTMEKDFPAIELVSTNRYGGATTESAYQESENLLNRFPELAGIFCPNESTTFGMLRALQVSGKAGKIKFVGFDSSEKLVQALREGEIHGLVLQNPFRMGEVGVKTVLLHIRGEKVKKRINTGVHLATKENMDDPSIKALLTPDLSKYLKE